MKESVGIERRGSESPEVHEEEVPARGRGGLSVLRAGKDVKKKLHIKETNLCDSL